MCGYPANAIHGLENPVSGVWVDGFGLRLDVEKVPNRSVARRCLSPTFPTSWHRSRVTPSQLVRRQMNRNRR